MACCVRGAAALAMLEGVFGRAASTDDQFDKATEGLETRDRAFVRLKFEAAPSFPGVKPMDEAQRIRGQEQVAPGLGGQPVQVITRQLFPWSAIAGMHHAVDSTGRVLRDNVWGPQEEDAVRRDFTINAMYYDPKTQVVVDYHNGIRDSKIGRASCRERVSSPV